MEKDLELYLNNFKEHLGQLNICDTKVKEGQEKIARTESVYEKNLTLLEKALEDELLSFKSNLQKITEDDIARAAAKLSLLRDEHNFFVNTYEILSTGENDAKKDLRAGISRLNLLLEAALKLKMFLEDRYSKIQIKYEGKNLKEFDAIYKQSILVAEKITYTVSLHNARLTFLFAKEMEISSKLQTFEAVLTELKKRFKNIA